MAVDVKSDVASSNNLHTYDQYLWKYPYILGEMLYYLPSFYFHIFINISFFNYVFFKGADAKAFFEEVLPMFSPILRDADLERFAQQKDSKLPKFSYVGPILHRGKTTCLIGTILFLFFSFSPVFFLYHVHFFTCLSSGPNHDITNLQINVISLLFLPLLSAVFCTFFFNF